MSDSAEYLNRWVLKLDQDRDNKPHYEYNYSASDDVFIIEGSREPRGFIVTMTNIPNYSHFISFIDYNSFQQVWDANPLFSDINIPTNEEFNIMIRTLR